MSKQSRIGAIIAVIALAALIGGAAYWRERQAALEPEAPSAGPGAATQPIIVGKNAIFVADQPPGSGITVGFALIERDGFVAIHEERAGTHGAVIGASALLGMGESRNVDVSLDRRSQDGETLFAMLHADDGDGTFDAAKDLPVRDAEGRIIVMPFMIDRDADASIDITL